MQQGHSRPFTILVVVLIILMVLGVTWYAFIMMRSEDRVENASETTQQQTYP